MTQIMQALFIVPGPTGGVYEFREIPAPTPGPGEVLVAVRAAGTNRGELLARPLLRSDNPAIKPMRTGIEFAGEIVALGTGSKRMDTLEIALWLAALVMLNTRSSLSVP